MVYVLDFLSNEGTKKRLGVPANVTYNPLSEVVHNEFVMAGDM